MKSSFAIIGCGKVGTVLGKFLIQSGYQLTGLTCRTHESAQKAAEIIGTQKFGTNISDILEDADIIFITTPDGNITSVCEEIVQCKEFNNNKIVLHCSGAHPSTILTSAQKIGASIGSMHPLQSFASSDASGNSFKGIIVAVEGDKKAVDAGCRMAEDLGSTILKIKTDAKVLYHAAAVVACNYLVTLQGLALSLMEKSGVSQKEAFSVLSPLIKGTLSNIEQNGVEKALTGPIARGDIETINRHITEIGKEMKELLPLYKILGIYTTKVAKNGGYLSEEKALQVNDLFIDALI